MKMRRFIKKIFWFISILISMVFIDLLLQKKLLFKSEDLILDKTITTLIIGHSHPECAYNTKFIENTFNIGRSGEAYLYTYFKLRKVIESNSQINRVFVEYTNNQIEKGMDNWMWDDSHLQYNFVNYETILDKEALELLYTKNPSGFINAFSKGLFDNLKKILFTENNKIKNGSMGGYKPHDEVFVLPSDKKQKIIKFNNEVSEYNLLYLQKIIKFCKKNNIEICLVRSPMHKTYNISFTEKKYISLLNSKFKNIQWLDNKDFELPDKGYRDNEHLNSFGATIYSKYFNSIINNQNDSN